jgi:two-component system, chemotaxis family, chemotaxis protein CheY
MSNKKILVVDDYSINRSITRTYLLLQGFDVDSVEDGAKGLELVKKNKYDLIITDIEMPNMNGYEFLTSIRQNSLNKTTPVIMLSTLDKIEDINRAKRLGANFYIVKPIDDDKLKFALDSLKFKNA